MRLSDVYSHSMVIASDYRIADPVKVGRLLEKRKDGLAANAGRPDLAMATTAAALALVIALLSLPWREALSAALAAAGWRVVATRSNT